MTSLERRARRSADGEVVLPLTFGQAVRSEFRRCFQRPYETPIVVAANAALMLFAWYLIPFGLRDAGLSLTAGLDVEMPYQMVRAGGLDAALADGRCV